MGCKCSVWTTYVVGVLTPWYVRQEADYVVYRSSCKINVYNFIASDSKIIEMYTNMFRLSISAYPSIMNDIILFTISLTWINMSIELMTYSLI